MIDIITLKNLNSVWEAELTVSIVLQNYFV